MYAKITAQIASLQTCSYSCRGQNSVWYPIVYKRHEVINYFFQFYIMKQHNNSK